MFIQLFSKLCVQTLEKYSNELMNDKKKKFLSYMQFLMTLICH